VALYQAALARLDCDPARVVSYEELLDSRDFSVLREADVLRIESPGEDFGVERRLIAWGADDRAIGSAPRLTASAAQRLEFDRGRVAWTRQWYCGFRRLLDEVAAAIAGGGLELYNSPADIALMFDKPRCQTHLDDHGTPTPPRLRQVSDFAELRDAAAERRWTRLFVKLFHGSSASGVAAVHLQPDGVRVVTTAELVSGDTGPRIYNNLKMQVYAGDDAARVVDLLLQEGAHVERWLQKATIGDGRGFDLRIVVIAGRPRHVVVRASRSPMTNLHLGNERGDLDELKLKMGKPRWQSVLDTASGAAGAFPESLYVGVDLLVEPGFRRSCVLEVNAFGDLLPGVLHEGRDTYEWEVLSEGSR
jgi:hypothetical protein